MAEGYRRVWGRSGGSRQLTSDFYTGLTKLRLWVNFCLPRVELAGYMGISPFLKVRQICQICSSCSHIHIHVHIHAFMYIHVHNAHMHTPMYTHIFMHMEIHSHCQSLSKNFFLPNKDRNIGTATIIGIVFLESNLAICSNSFEIVITFHSAISLLGSVLRK